MSDFGVNFGSVEMVIDDFVQQSRQIQAELEAMEQAVESKMQEWAGGAREEYYRAKQNWDQSADAMVLTLERASSVIHNQMQNYSMADKAQSQRFAE